VLSNRDIFRDAVASRLNGSYRVPSINKLTAPNPAHVEPSTDRCSLPVEASDGFKGLLPPHADAKITSRTTTWPRLNIGQFSPIELSAAIANRFKKVEPSRPQQRYVLSHL
jgi:hypothetical protein